MDYEKNLCWFLNEVGNTDLEQIETGSVEIFGVDEQGQEGSCEVEITELAQAAASRIEELEERIVSLDKALCEEIENRDHWEERASKLAFAVGEHFGQDIGEHSSANCPINNAHDLLNQI